jgi:hypothetical protein
MMEDCTLNGQSISTVTSEAREGDVVCGVEVEISYIKDGRGSYSAAHSSSWSLSSADARDECDEKGRYDVVFAGPFLPDTCEIDDLADGLCSPVYNLRRKASRSKQVVQLQLTNPTLSVNSMTDQSEAPSCPSDEKSPVSYVYPLDSQSGENFLTTFFDDARESSPDISLVDYHSSASEETTATTDSSEETAPALPAHSCSCSNGSKTAFIGPPLPPTPDVSTQTIINVMEPRPDRRFLDMVERTHRDLRQITFCQADLQSAFSSYLPRMFLRRERLPAFVALRDFGDGGFLMACCEGPPVIPSTALRVSHTQFTNDEITLRGLAGQDPYQMILRQLQLMGEAASLRSQVMEWSSKSMVPRQQSYTTSDSAARQPAIAHEKPAYDDMLDLAQSTSDDASTVLFEDDDLRAIMATTKGGNDLSQILPCMSDDTTATFETDDGLCQELKALDILEGDLRKQLQDADLLIKGVYVHDVKMKSESSERLFEKDGGRRRGRPQKRRVHFSKTNSQYVFSSDHPDTEGDNAESLGEMLMTTCEDLYSVFEEVSEEIGYACVHSYNSNKAEVLALAARSGKRPIQRSTVHFCP